MDGDEREEWREGRSLWGHPYSHNQQTCVKKTNQVLEHVAQRPISRAFGISWKRVLKFTCLDQQVFTLSFNSYD